MIRSLDADKASRFLADLLRSPDSAVRAALLTFAQGEGVML
jgi:hypothetical protein